MGTFHALSQRPPKMNGAPCPPGSRQVLASRSLPKQEGQTDLPGESLQGTGGLNHRVGRKCRLHALWAPWGGVLGLPQTERKAAPGRWVCPITPLPGVLAQEGLVTLAKHQCSYGLLRAQPLGWRSQLGSRTKLSHERCILHTPQSLPPACQAETLSTPHLPWGPGLHGRKAAVPATFPHRPNLSALGASGRARP